MAETLRADVRHYRDRIGAAVATLRAHEAAADLPIGAIGFCMGGQAVLELARDGADLDVVVSFHGILATGRPAQPGDTIRPRILICHGDKDPLVPRPQVWRSGRKWTAPMPTGTFMPTPAPSMASPIPTATRGLPAIGYDASADRQSWAAMLSLLRSLGRPGRLNSGAAGGISTQASPPPFTTSATTAASSAAAMSHGRHSF
jgi:dienelactone hydrolase